MRSPTERFSDRVADYVRYRPGYPLGVIDLISAEVGLTPSTLIADVGCGTGIFARHLLETSAAVVGVEPNQAMLDAAVAELGLERRFFPICKTAEQTGILAHTIDAITAAQAFHWFKQDEAREEFQRILKQGGKVFLIWNERKTSGSEFADIYEQTLVDFCPEYAEAGHRNTPDEDILAWFQSPAKLAIFSNTQMLNRESFLGRVYSSSYVPSAGTPERDAITQRLNEIFDQCAVKGHIEMVYETKVFFGPIGA